MTRRKPVPPPRYGSGAWYEQPRQATTVTVTVPDPQATDEELIAALQAERRRNEFPLSNTPYEDLVIDLVHSRKEAVDTYGQRVGRVCCLISWRNPYFQGSEPS